MSNTSFLREACVQTLHEAISAEKNGADLIELCAHLEFDGLTPSRDLIKTVLKELSIPVKVMVRPRKGDFVYNKDDVNDIRRDISLCQSLGVSEIVFGATNSGQLDIELIQKVANWSKDMQITIHKAIDTVIDPFLDIEKLKPIPNVKSILSSGQSQTAWEGIDTLLKMKDYCGTKINLIAAGKVTSSNINEIHNKLDLTHYHGRRIVNLEGN